jgi:hypothetical protein
LNLNLSSLFEFKIPDPIYVEILTSEDFFLVKKCLAYPEGEDPEKIFWTLIEDGMPVDKSVIIYPTGIAQNRKLLAEI